MGTPRDISSVLSCFTVTLVSTASRIKRRSPGVAEFSLPTTLSRIGVTGLLLTLIIVLIAVVAPEAGPGPDSQQLTRILESPASSHLMGTDQLGRDQLSRVATGARSSILTVLVVLAVSGLGGGILGLFSGYRGGVFDLLLQRAVDAVMAMPLVILVLAVVVASGASFWGVAIAIGVAFSPLSIRVARSSAVSIRGAEYIASARLNGASNFRIVFRHLVPNAAGPWAIVAASQAGAAVLAEASLAFLGVAPGRITLGGLLGGDAQTYMHGAPWLIIWPGIALALLALAVNLLGEWMAEGVSSGPRS